MYNNLNNTKEGVMTKVKRNCFVAFISILLLLSIGLFFGCQKDNKGGENPTTLGSGTIVESEIDGKVKYTAVADKWNVFAGWFDGPLKYSNNATILVDSETPDNLVAKFETSGLLAIDRILNGSYYVYEDLVQNEGEFFNMDYHTTLAIQGKTYSASLDVERGGYFSKSGGFHDYAVVKDGDEVLFSQYYIDDSQDSMLYIDYGDRKVAVEDFQTVGSFLVDFPTISQNVWKMKDLVSNKIYSTLDNYLGFRNSVGMISEVENTKNKTKIVLNADALLNELKDKISALDDEELAGFKDLILTLTNQYQGIANKLPKIVLEAEIQYTTQGENEIIDKVTFKATFEENYNFSLDNNLFTIPACTMMCVIENVDIRIGSTPNAVPLEIITAFPEAVHSVNFHADSTLYFLKEDIIYEGEFDVIDEYKIEYDSDINACAIVDAITKEGEFDQSKIDWQNLGFLSLKISLVENPDDSEQLSRHNGEKEYLNLLIDTQKFGAKALVYVGLYNPKTLNGTATSNYILSGTYEIPALVKYMPEVVENLENIGEDGDGEAQTLSQSQNSNIVANLVSASVKSSIDFIQPEVTSDEILFRLFMELLKTIAPENQVVQEGLTFTDFGSTLAVGEVKDLIEEKFSQTDDVLSSLGLQNNIFGNKTTHIAIKAGEILHGGVVQNQQNEYVDADGNTFVGQFNSAHKMLIGVADNSQVTGGLDDASFTKAGIKTEVENLNGKSLTIETGLFSDNSTSTTFENCQGNQAKLAMRVFRAEYTMIDEDSAEITVYLSFSAGTLQSLMVGTFDLPYGLVSYTTQVELN